MSSLCTHRWGYSVIDFGKNQAKTCCRTTLDHQDKITYGGMDQLKALGSDFFLNSEYQKQRRLEMFKGIRHKSCETCWVLEKRNVQSPRKYGVPAGWEFENNVITNISSGETTHVDELTVDHPILKSNTPYMIEVNLSNHCDMSCLYCSPFFSSTWAVQNTDVWAESVNPNWKNEFFSNPANKDWPQEVKDKIQAQVKDRNETEFNEAFWQWFSTIFEGQNELRIGILGGEPINNPRLPDFIDRMCSLLESIPMKKRPHSGYWDKENKCWKQTNKPLLWFVTNGNTREAHFKKFIDRLPRLCKLFTVEISISIESYKERAEYIRMNLVWDRFESNVRKYLELDLPDLQIGFQTSINNLCVTSMPDFANWCVELYDNYQKPLFLKPNVVTNPAHYKTNMLPASYKKYLDDACEIFSSRTPENINDEFGTWPKYVAFLQTIICNQSGTHAELETLKNFLHSMDIRRNLDCRDVFPEMWEFWNLVQGISAEDWAAIQEMMND
tara:strand:- start:925 stop:2421 length:1497 start_codon:yes stop_codon:yes gene_type:complete